MPNRRNGYGGRLDFAVRSDELLDRAERAAPEFTRDLVSPRRVCVHDSDQPNRFPLLRQLVIHPGVVMPEGAHSNHGYVDDVVVCQITVLAQLKPI